MSRDFWRKSKVAVLGGGSWGTVLASLVAKNCAEVLLWMRNEEDVRSVNSTRFNPRYVKELELPPNLKAYSELARVFEQHPTAIIWALPSKVCRDQGRVIAEHLNGHEIILHATKGVETGTLKRVSEILKEELPTERIGVISGPNLAPEIARGDPAATVVASNFDEVVDAGRRLLAGPKFRVYPDHDVVGVEWAGALKNILAISAGSLDSMGFGWNVRAMLISRGLAEMVRFGVALGAKESTFLGLAGAGDLLATCASNLSRNYQVGYRLAKGQKLDEILEALGSVAEGVRTVQNVWDFARDRSIPMPISEAVYGMVRDELSAPEALKFLMEYPVLA